MTTLTGRNERTLLGYADSLLDYPRWLIARDVDFTHCEYRGVFTQSAHQCVSCEFGVACHWLTRSQGPDTLSGQLPERLHTLGTAADYVRKSRCQQHSASCNCSHCAWLRQARAFLRSHRQST